MSTSQFTATMTIPKDGKNVWTDIMQNPSTLPEGVTENQYIAASYAKFSNGVSVFGGVAAGPIDSGYNYALFMVFDTNMNQIGGWPIDTSDWEDFHINSISFCIDPNCDEEDYELSIVEATT